MSIETINGAIVRDAAKWVAIHDNADIHTVTIELNGQHGGYDVKIEGIDRRDDSDYERSFPVERWQIENTQ